MADSFSFGKIELVASTEAAAVPVELGPTTPFRILVIGDFSGRANRGPTEAGTGLATRRPLRIDRDNFDQVLARLGVELRLPLADGGDTRIALQFRELEDFHPDRIYERLDAFRTLREIRRKLNNP